MPKRILVSIYSHPEMYPPTLNAIQELAGRFDTVIVLYRNSLFNDWKYADNVVLVPYGPKLSIRQQEQMPLLKKVFVFMGFVKKQLSLIVKYKPGHILLYDSIALLSYHLVKKGLRKSLVWYHSHDVPEANSVRKYSIAWFSFRAEKRAFRYLDIFTLPAKERLQYFPVEELKGTYFIIPNYPSLAFYRNFYTEKHLPQTIRIIYQGHISELHGIEQVIELLRDKIEGYNLNLILKGPCKDDYKELLQKMAMEYGVNDKIEFIDITPYAQVPVLCSTCHIGIGIHAKQDKMNTSLGTASNKLYEYAALGLPVLYYKNNHFNNYLQNYPWALATELNSADIKRQIVKIIDHYSEVSSRAHEDFVNELNFEFRFMSVVKYLESKIMA